MSSHATTAAHGPDDREPVQPDPKARAAVTPGPNRQPAEKKQLNRYRLNIGAHSQADPRWEAPTDAAGNKLVGAVAPTQDFKPGAEVESDVNLCKRFNEAGVERFTYLGPAKNPQKPRSAMPGGGPDPADGPVNDHPATPEVSAPRPTPASTSNLPAGSAPQKKMEDDQGLKDQGPGKATGKAKGRTLAAVEKDYGKLEQMTKDDLISLAHEEGIDLAGASKKDEILDAIKADLK